MLSTETNSQKLIKNLNLPVRAAADPGTVEVANGQSRVQSG